MSDRHRTELLLAFAVALGIFVAYQVRHVLLLIYISALSSIVIGPVIELVGRVRIRRFDYHSARFFCCDPGSCLLDAANYS
jgi:predicted PurR-regulated permease PerM